jgi:hypothetical protein
VVSLKDTHILHEVTPMEKATAAKKKSAGIGRSACPFVRENISE